MTLPLLLFTQEPEYGAAAVRAGVAGIVVDWEGRGKAARQRGAETEVNWRTPEDLVSMRSAFDGHLICRINNDPGAATRGGAPGGRPRRQRSLAARWSAASTRSRTAWWCPCLGVTLGVLAETREAMQMGRALSELPLTRVYVGLNDYRIDRGHAGLFDPLLDGTVDRLRDEYSGALGVAGVTDRGAAGQCRSGCCWPRWRACAADLPWRERSFRADVQKGRSRGGRPADRSRASTARPRARRRCGPA